MKPQNVGAFMPGGGCGFNNVHNIQGAVSPENILTMLDPAYVYGFYSSNAQAQFVKTNRAARFQDFVAAAGF